MLQLLFYDSYLLIKQILAFFALKEGFYLEMPHAFNILRILSRECDIFEHFIAFKLISQIFTGLFP